MIDVREIDSEECVMLFAAALESDTTLATPITPRMIAQALRTWTLVGIFSPDTELIGVAGCDARGETHIHITDAWQGRWNVRTSVKAAYMLLFAHHETLYLTIPRKNRAAVKVARYIGAELTGEDEESVRFVFHAPDALAS